MKQLKDMSKDERSLLLYLESRAVDNGGFVDGRHMNDDNREIARRWSDEGFILFVRTPLDVLRSLQSKSSNIVWLSQEAVRLAQEERSARTVRVWNSICVPRIEDCDNIQITRLFKFVSENPYPSSNPIDPVEEVGKATRFEDSQ